MLSIFRRGITAKIMLVFLAIGLFAIVVTGFGTDGMGGLGGLRQGQGADTLATVEGRALSERELSELLTRQYQAARQQQPDLGLPAFANEAFEPLLNQLITGLALHAFGERQGLVVAPRMIDREIVEIPAFRNFAGQFDENAFRQALREQNISEAQLRDDIARSLMQRQLLGPVARGAAVPEAVAREYANLLLERRRGAIGVVPTELMRAGIAPTDQQVAAFYRANLARFAIPERRVIQYAMIGPEQVAEQARATDQEIAAFYRENAAQFGPRETRTLQAVVMPDQAAAQAFVQRLRGGASFTDAAAQAGYSAADVTFADQSREAFAGETSPQVAAAAFAAEQGALVGPLRSELGFHVVRVQSVSRTPARPLAAVRDEIARAIEQRKLGEAINALIERVEDRIAGGASLAEAAREERLNVVTTPPITESGQAPGQLWVVPAEMQPLLRTAFRIDPDDREPIIEQIAGTERFALVGIERVVPAAAPPLAAIQAQVRDALIAERALQRGRALADRIAARINGGLGASAAFAEAQPRLPAPESIDMQRLDISRAGQQAPAPLIALFSIPQGRAHVMAAPNGRGWFVVHHAERTPGDASDQPDLVATTRAEFAQSAAEEMAQQFARATEQASRVQRNEEAIRRARQRLSGSVLE